MYFSCISSNFYLFFCYYFVFLLYKKLSLTLLRLHMKKGFAVVALTLTVLLATGCAGLEPEQVVGIAGVLMGE